MNTERLNELRDLCMSEQANPNALEEAIDEIDALRAEVAALKAGLELIVSQKVAKTGEWKAGVEWMQEHARALLAAPAKEGKPCP